MRIRASGPSQSGFTLIEVIVALVILAGLSMLTAQAIRSGVENRDQVSGELAREARVADALNIIRSDVSLAFHHRDITIRMLNEINKPPTPPPVPTPDANGNIPPTPPPTPFDPNASPPPTPRPTPKIVTDFVGDGVSMYFTSLANVRVLRDSKESSQAKIGYYLRSCSSMSARSGKANTSNCLVRTVAPYFDEDVTKPGAETVLLENVLEFNLRYMSVGNEELLESWKSKDGADANTKDKFPFAVEVTLSAHDKSDPKDKRVTATALIPIRFPNNPPKATPDPNKAPGT
ncbi:MAG: type II secretion system protein GspJ [Bdellovibrionota bacterium]